MIFEIYVFIRINTFEQALYTSQQIQKQLFKELINYESNQRKDAVDANKSKIVKKNVPDELQPGLFELSDDSDDEKLRVLSRHTRHTRCHSTVASAIDTDIYELLVCTIRKHFKIVLTSVCI